MASRRGEVLTLSSASMGISFIVFAAAFGCLFASLPFTVRPLLAWLEPNNPVLQKPPPPNATLLGVALLIAGFGPISLYFSCCGTWHIDDEGIEFRHFFKKQRKYLRWQDVDQVHWMPIEFGLIGKGIRLRAYWHWFPKPKQQQARSRLEAILSRDFDLTIVPVRTWSFEPNFRSRATWALKIAGIASAVVAALVGNMVLVVLFADWDSLLGRSIAWLWLAFWAVLCSILLYYMTTKRPRQLNPYWRMRRAHDDNAIVSG